MSRFLVLLAGLALLLALLYHCLFVRPPEIQADVLACVEQKAAAAGLDTVIAAVDGRDVRLYGDVADEAAKVRAGQLAGDDCGARMVANEILVVAPEPYRTSLCIDRDGLRVGGELPGDAAGDRYLQIAAERLGAVDIRATAVDRADPPAGYDRLMRTAFGELAQLDHGCIELVGNEVRVFGEVRSAAALDRLVSDMDAAAGDEFRISYELTVPELSAEAVACQEALDLLLAPGEQVLFDFDSAELHEEGRRLLASAEDIWETCPDISLIVAGHTDSVGEAEYNRALSERRANAVADYLVELGFEPGKLTPIGYGEAQPQASNDTEEGRTLNRRMEFRVREDAR